jgi:hypothetical protein
MEGHETMQQAASARGRTVSDTARVSLDYPFEGWHELVNCYRNTGWQIDRREVRGGDHSAGDWPLVVAVMQDDLDRQAVLCYSVLDRGGFGLRCKTTRRRRRIWNGLFGRCRPGPNGTACWPSAMTC